MRRAVAFVRIELDRHFTDGEARTMRVDDHFGGKFHSGRVGRYLLECLAGKGPHPAVKITNGRVVKQPGDA